MKNYAPINENKDVVTKEYVDPIKSQAAINRTTLGTQCKNLLKNTAVTKTVNGVTFTVNDDKSITVSGKSTSSSTTFYNVCKTGELTLENDKSYIMTGCPADNKDDNGKTLCYLRADSSKGAIASDTGNGVTFTTSESSSPTYAIICVSANADFTDNPVTFYPMIRYADILDDTYEPYQPSVQEQTPYSISVSGKSTSAAISYSGVPTLICLTPNTADSAAGGLYMINSAGAVVKLIEKTGVVVAAASSSKTFTITNNTSTVMDVCISRCWGR